MWSNVGKSIAGGFDLFSRDGSKLLFLGTRFLFFHNIRMTRVSVLRTVGTTDRNFVGTQNYP
jgi:hypothetical protein